MKVMFIEAKSNREVQLDKTILALKDFQKVSVISTVQFLNQVPFVIKTLERAGKQVFIAKPRLHAVKEAQVLGCDATAALDLDNKIDCVLYVGTGLFHPLGAGYHTEKPVFRLDPFTGQIEMLSEKQIRKWQLQQQARIVKAKEANVYGILVTQKPGQNEMQAKAYDLKKKFEAQGKRAYVFISDTINTNDLLNFPQIECWVNTACPRMVDDQELYNKPIVNASELE